MERVGVLLGLLFLTALPLRAETPQELFKQGNTAYAQGKFEDAAKLYQSACDQGLRHWALSYNLGNSYYKTGQLGRAVLYYERAFRMNSSNRDLLHNLELVTIKAGDPELPGAGLPALLWRSFYFLSLNTLTLIVSLTFLGLCVWAGLILRNKLPWRSDFAVPPLFFLFIFGVWLAGRIYFQEKSLGVVVSNLAEVRSGPSTTYPANFTVPEGHRALILEEQEPVSGWVEIGVPEQGLKGWVPDDSIQHI